ncbi:type II toxin-antitoxin system PemK/MazF family toxin [Candidatus Bipolaricaulota bacterium]|nr:type II toxin-antitoxin system PemK/MazF family toxin [Candidatus Bipolaricaulota bacterium]
MVISQGEVWWASLPVPTGSAPGFRRPVVVVQGDAFNRSRLATVVCVPLTSNLKWADAPGNVLLKAETTGLPKDSVALVAEVITLDRSVLIDRCGKLASEQVKLILSGLDIVLGR